MFTGIIEELGHVRELQDRDAGARLVVECGKVLHEASIGASIAVNGACLTAVELGMNHFSADLAPETLKRTNLGDLKPGAKVNLERPLRAHGRIDGHFVLGHVDATGEIESFEELGDQNWWLRVRVPSELSRYVVNKGSVAVNGISLTVAEIDGNLASFTVIPHTFQFTNLHTASAGSRVNLEVDILAKHLEKLTSSQYASSAHS